MGHTDLTTLQRYLAQVVIRQRPETAKGHMFITLEDETGLVNLIIRPKLFEKRKDTTHCAMKIYSRCW